MIGSLMGRKGVKRLSDKVGAGQLKLLGTVTLTAAGTTSQPIPSGAKVVRAQAWGAGGGGGSQQSSSFGSRGGAGGAYVEGCSAIPSGVTTVSCTVGAGGTNGGNGVAGGDSFATVGATTIARAYGGPVNGTLPPNPPGLWDTSGIALLLGSGTFELLRVRGGYPGQNGGGAPAGLSPPFGGNPGGNGYTTSGLTANVGFGGGGGAGPGGGNGGNGGSDQDQGTAPTAPGGGGGGGPSTRNFPGAPGQLVLTFWG